jgi:hypothetical protein
MVGNENQTHRLYPFGDHPNPDPRDPLPDRQHPGNSEQASQGKSSPPNRPYFTYYKMNSNPISPTGLSRFQFSVITACILVVTGILTFVFGAFLGVLITLPEIPF